MKQEEIKQFLKWITNTYPDNYARMLKTEKYKKYYDYIILNTPMLNDKKYKMSTKVYWILNDITDFPKCYVCGTPITKNVISVNLGYKNCDVIGTHIHCPKQSCCQKDKETLDLIEQTSYKLYGTRRPQQSQQVKDKVANTKLINHGDSGYNNYDKIRETVKLKYGVDYVSQTSWFQNKYKQTSINKYGVPNPSMAQCVKDKRIKTCLNHFGVKYPMQSKEVRDKIHSKYLYDNEYFDSSYELIYYVYLKNNNIPFVYKPDPLEYYFNNEQHRYFPDFLIYDIYVEIKGDHLIDQNGNLCDPYNPSRNDLMLAKQKCMEDNKVLLLKYKDLKPIEKYIKSIYGTDFIRKHKR